LLRHSINIILLAGVLMSCDKLYKPLETEEEVEGTPIARVNDIYLYEEDLKGLTPTGMKAEDSAQLAQKYLNSWLKKQLTISRASKEIHFDEANIERKVLDYRYALMAHEYEKFYVNQRLEKEILEEEIEAYWICLPSGV